MPFYSDSFSSKQKCEPEGYHAVVYNMSLFLVAGPLNRWQSASSARCLQKKARGLTTPRSSNPPSPDSADVIGVEVEVSQRWALRQHSCKPLCPSLADPIVAEIEVHQRCAMRQHSCKPLCPAGADPIAAEIEVHQRCA